MLSKKEIKDIQSLGHKKFRDESKLFVAEGAKIVNELIAQIPDQVICLYATNEWIKNCGTDKLDIKEISEIELGKISFLQTPNQVLAVIKKFEVKQPVGYSLLLYLDTIQDPGNLGTIIRSADWFNVKHVVCSPGCADLYNAKTIQATMASITNVSVYLDTDGLWLQDQKMIVYAASLKGKSIYEIENKNKGIIVI
ncbi:MAG: RNA methyltransferase [Flavisolibacter sp.]